MVGRDGDGQSVAIWGTEFGDSFTVDGGENSWLEILGGRGSDSYNLTLSGDIRLSFCFDWYSSATQGVVLDLAAQTITNDGYGNSESLMLTAGAGRLFIVGTDLADNITGSNNDEVFLLRNGNDTLDGGGGYDRVRYDNSRFTSGVTVDLAAGTASGAWNGVAFTHSLTGIEDVRGSSLADVISGTDGGERFDGRAGNDSLVGNGGSDTLFGGDGTDTLNGGTGDDFLYGGDSEADQRDMINGGDGNDSIDGGWGNDELLGGDGNDTVIGNLGVDRLVGNAGDDVLSGAGGADLLFGNDGNDLINGGWGFDRMNGGAGADRFFHQGIAEHGSDWIQDYSAADGDQLVFGNTGATVSQFRVNYAETANAGTAGVAEAFVIYLPTGQILWALVDGAAQEHINVVLGGQTYDLLA
jgi:Ca2+-binding RTX toxin-like protein